MESNADACNTYYRNLTDVGLSNADIVGKAFERCLRLQNMKSSTKLNNVKVEKIVLQGQYK